MAFRCCRSLHLLSMVKKCDVLLKKPHVISVNQLFIVDQNRGLRYGYARFERVMKQRRKIAGPEKIRKRSDWIDWNYQSELFAFPKRLHEEISEDTLRAALTCQSYIEAEERKRTELGMPVQDVPLNLIPNTHLVEFGTSLMSPYIKKFVELVYPMLPEEGVSSIHDFLLSDEVLSHVSSNIGTTDLILTEEFPVISSTLALVFKAIIGAIATDSNQERAELFVQDFVCTQLIGKDVLDLWEIRDPIAVLSALLTQHGRSPYEPRLLFESGRNTLESIFVIALFSDKVFLGKGPGETLVIAEEMAALDAIRRLFHVKLNEQPLPFGKSGRHLNFDNMEHPLISEWESGILKDKSADL